MNTLPLGQTRRPLRPILVPLSAATTLLKLRHEAVLEMVDCGELRWVWNIARTGASRAEYRFWLMEIFQRIGAEPLNDLADSRAAVVEKVIGRAEAMNLLHTESVADIFGTRRQTVHAWLARKEMDGAVVGAKQYVTRASLAKFLERRLVA